MKLLYLIIILLSLLAYKFADLWSIKTHEMARTEIQSAFLKSETSSTIGYSVLTPGIAQILQKIIKPVAGTQARAYLYAYELINFTAFLLVFIFFYIYLKMFFTELASIIGLFLFLAVIPVAISRVWPEVDILNFLFYTIGFILIFKSREQFLPLIIGLGMLNDESIIFLIIFYIIYLASDKKLYTKKSFIVVILCVLSGAAVYSALRFKFEPQISENILQVSENIKNISSVLQFLIAELLIFVILSLKAFRSADKFFRLSFISLGIFIILFFLFGNMNDFAKFFPAYLILIPMSLHVLTSGSNTTDLKLNHNIK